MSHAFRFEFVPVTPTPFDPARDAIHEGDLVVMWPAGPDRVCYWGEVVKLDPTGVCDVQVFGPEDLDGPWIATIPSGAVMFVVGVETFKRAEAAGYPCEIEEVTAFVSVGGAP